MQAPQKHFVELRYFPVQEAVLHQVLLPSHFFREKLFLQKGSVLGNKDLAFGSEVEGIPNGFLRVSYEDTFFRLGFELFRLKFLDISIASPNF